MPDLRERLRQLDSLEVPDVMDHARRLGPKRPDEPGPLTGRRIAIAVFALLLALVPILGMLRSFDQVNRQQPARPSRPGDCRWLTTSYDVPDLGDAAGLVTGTAPDDVWVGEGHSLLHFDGEAWTEVEQPSQQIKQIEAVAPDDLWLLGPGAVYRFNGEDWRRELIGADAASMHVVAADDAWAVGNVDDRAVVQHWDGQAWNTSFTATDLPRDLTPDWIASVSAWAPDDVWAVGSREKGQPGGIDLRPVVLHWDGTAWSIVPYPDRAPSSHQQDFAEAVVASGPAEAIVATSQGMMRRDGARWVKMQPGKPYGWSLVRADGQIWGLTGSMHGNALAHLDGDEWDSKSVGDIGANEPWAYGIGAVGRSVFIVGGDYGNGDVPPFLVRYDC